MLTNRLLHNISPVQMQVLTSNAGQIRHSSQHICTHQHPQVELLCRSWCAPPSLPCFNLNLADQDQNNSKTNESGNLNEFVKNRSAYIAPVATMQCNLSNKAVKADVALQECVGEFRGARDRVSQQWQMMADGNLRGFWSKQGRFSLKKYGLRSCFYISRGFSADEVKAECPFMGCTISNMPSYTLCATHCTYARSTQLHLLF